MEPVVQISEDEVKRILTWQRVYNAVEISMKGVSSSESFQNPRAFTPIPGTENVLLTMPGYLKDQKYGALGCKLVTAFAGNNKKNLPTILANILIFNEETGALKAIVAGTEITTWRTAAASVVATKHIFKPLTTNKLILAILGAGTQGEIHAVAFAHFYNFVEIRIWNRTRSRAENLIKRLNNNLGRKGLFILKETTEDCVRGADIVVTATHASEPLVKTAWLKDHVHINAVGAGTTHHSELEEEIYKKADIYIDSEPNAKNELKGLYDSGIKPKGEVGGVINKSLTLTGNKLTVFQSMGMALEDCAVARMVYDLYKK